MADIRPCRVKAGRPPQQKWYPVAVSQTIKAGDPIGLWYVSSNPTVAKVLTSTQYDDYTSDAGSDGVCGIIGFSGYDITTDASGYCLSTIVPSSVSAAIQPVTPIPQYSAGVTWDKVDDRPELGVFIADDDTEFRIRLTTGGSAVTVTEAYVGTPVGLILSSGVWSADVAASTKCAVITRVFPNDMNYNTSSALCHVAIKIKPAYQQIKTGLRYGE